MSDDATVVWLGEGEAREDAARALREWARARGVRLLTAQHGTAPTEALSPDETIADRIADRVEKDLARAREAINASDADGADRSLARASALLRAHPEAPQAAWQRAEVERAWAMRWLRLQPRDEAAAQAAWATAAALDGGRVAGVGEPSYPAAPRVKATLIAAGASADHATLYFDGTRVEPASKDGSTTTYTIEAGPAEHAVLVSSDGRVLFADWVAITSTPPAPIRIMLADGGACGKGALARVRRDDARIVAPGVTCPAWVAALPAERRGSVFVARCEHDACGPLLEWRVESPAGQAGAAAPAPNSSRWPAWATWTLLGIGAATVASVALVATGVFEARPVEPRFVVGGAKQE